MEVKLIFNYKNKSLAPGQKEEIKLQCYHNRKYRYIDTGVFVESAHWDNVNNFISSTHPQFKAVSILLSNKLNALNNHIYDYERDGKRVFDFSTLNSYKTGGKDSIYICDFIEKSLKNEYAKLDVKTVVKYRANIETLRVMLPDMPIESISPDDIRRFDAALRVKYAPSTVARINVFVQKYIKQAMAEGVTNENPYLKAKTDKFRGHSKQVFLTPDEIVMFEGFETENKTLEVVRDRFLYSVYTGLRISDNMALKKSMLTATPDGFVVDLHTLKGYGHDLIHPLWLLFDGKPDAIAKKYIDTPGEYLFPAQSDQTINDGLKIITGILQLKKPVTFHVARHTCATMLAEVTQNPFLMLRLMGWTDVKIAMKYVHGSRESTRRQLDVFKGKWL